MQPGEPPPDLESRPPRGPESLAATPPTAVSGTPQETPAPVEQKASKSTEQVGNKASHAASKLIPVGDLAAMHQRGSTYHVRSGRSAGLSEGMVLKVVAAPVKDSKARFLGEATVLEVFPQRSVVEPDARVRKAGSLERFLVLPSQPAPPAQPAPAAESSTPSAAPASASAATPAAPRELSGRILIKSVGPFLKKIELTNTDTILWSGCILVARGRDMYKLGGMAPGGRREIALHDFEKGGREVPFVGKNRLGLFCTEGQKEFPAKNL